MPTATASFNTKEKISLIGFISPLPQYWAQRTDEPLANPNVSTCSIKNGWLAREEAERSIPVVSARPSIMVSIKLVPRVIKFCKAIGIAIANIFL